MKIATPSDLTPNACVLFEYRGFKHIRRVVDVKHDESFANPGGGGDVYVVKFESRFLLPDSAEYPPTNEIAILDESDLGDVLAAGFDLVRIFAEVVAPPLTEAFGQLAELSPEQLREIFEHATPT